METKGGAGRNQDAEELKLTKVYPSKLTPIAIAVSLGYRVVVRAHTPERGCLPGCLPGCLGG